MQHRARYRRSSPARLRWGSSTIMGVVALSLVVASHGTAIALPAQTASTDREFASSFESGDPAPTWLNTVDTGADGAKRASGVDGGYSSGIPGNVTDHVTDVRASGEN